MNFISIKTILFLIFLPTLLLANEASIALLRGRAVFKSQDGQKIELKQGMTIKGDGMVATAAGSVAKLAFAGGGQVTLGPSSQMSLSQKLEDKPKVIELLRGKIRASMPENGQPPEGFEHKLFIKTRSASLGVRGTDFLVVHNPKNHVTSTVTFKGDVHLYKRNDEAIYESIREEMDGGKNTNEKQENLIRNLEDELVNQKRVSVKPGNFSGSWPSYEKAGAPVKINPVQLALLAQNSELNVGGKPKKIIKGSHSFQKGKTVSNDFLVPEPPGEKTPSTDEYDGKNADGVRAGGNLDLDTGIYVAPPADAPFNQKSGTYEMPKEMGGINSETGEYVPPEGLRLDPLKGFVGFGPELKKNSSLNENLEKLKKLTGSFNERLVKTLSIFKDISRLDVYGFLNYRFTTNAMENYYGEWRGISNHATMIWDWKIQGGFQLYHTSKWLIYPKAYFYTIYHEKDIAIVKRNDSMEMMFGWENHYKHYLFNKPARFVMDFEFKTVYMDYKQRSQYDYYTEDAGVKFSERFQFNRHHLTELYYQIRAFQGYHDPDHGNIHNMGALHRFYLGTFLDFQLAYEHSARKEQWTTNRYKIDRIESKIIFPDVFFQTDISGGYTWEWHYYQFEPLALSQNQNRPFKLNENMKNGFYYRAKLELDKRLGNFWKFGGLYEYSRQRTGGNGINKAFIGQTWGASLKMVF